MPQLIQPTVRDSVSIEQSASNSTSRIVSSGDGNRWRHLLGLLDKAIGDPKWRITVALAGFVLIKVIWIARGNIQTALAIFNSAGIVTVITGGLLSAFPLVSSLALAFVIFVLIRRQRREIVRRDHERAATGLGKAELRKLHGKEPTIDPVTSRDVDERLIWFTGLVAIVGCFFLTPWPIVVASVVFGLLSGFAAPMKEENRSKRVVVGERISVVILSVFAIIFVLNPLLYTVWLPHEMLTIPRLATKTKPNGEYIFGYVLSDSNGWVSVLQTGQRDILKFKYNEVTARALCHGQTVPIPFFLEIPQWYKSADPLSRWILGPGTAIPPCSPPQIHPSGTTGAPV
jgi:hypothetical protein